MVSTRNHRKHYHAVIASTTVLLMIMLLLIVGASSCCAWSSMMMTPPWFDDKNGSYLLDDAWAAYKNNNNDEHGHQRHRDLAMSSTERSFCNFLEKEYLNGRKTFLSRAAIRVDCVCEIESTMEPTQVSSSCALYFDESCSTVQCGTGLDEFRCLEDHTTSSTINETTTTEFCGYATLTVNETLDETSGERVVLRNDTTDFFMTTGVADFETYTSTYYLDEDFLPYDCDFRVDGTPCRTCDICAADDYSSEIITMSLDCTNTALPRSEPYTCESNVQPIGRLSPIQESVSRDYNPLDGACGALKAQVMTQFRHRGGNADSIQCECLEETNTANCYLVWDKVCTDFLCGDPSNATGFVCHPLGAETLEVCYTYDTHVYNASYHGNNTGTVDRDFSFQFQSGVMGVERFESSVFFQDDLPTGCTIVIDGTACEVCDVCINDETDVLRNILPRTYACTSILPSFVPYTCVTNVQPMWQLAMLNASFANNKPLLPTDNGKTESAPDMPTSEDLDESRASSLSSIMVALLAFVVAAVFLLDMEAYSDYQPDAMREFDGKMPTL